MLGRSHGTKEESLAAVPLFRGLPPKALARLASLADEGDVAAGKVLCAEGDYGTEFFVVVEGEAAVSKHGEDVATLGVGNFFGEIALVARTQRTATVTARTPLRFFVLTKQAFWTLLDEQPGVERIVLEVLAQRLAELEQGF